MILPALLLLAVNPNTQSFEKVLTLRPASIKSMHFSVKNRPADLELEFRTSRPELTARLIVIPKNELPRLEADRDYHQLAITDFAANGKLKTYIPTPGEYYVVVDNRHQGNTQLKVAVKGSLTADVTAREARYLSPTRQIILISCSLLCFFAVSWIAGRRLYTATIAKSPPPDEQA
ncbi:MAG: hypothetical protein HY820_01450 [Acidobacteria bacterium]|nr:hypothetical protein [Acidobacteriota bacterium]